MAQMKTEVTIVTTLLYFCTEGKTFGDIVLILLDTL